MSMAILNILRAVEVLPNGTERVYAGMWKVNELDIAKDHMNRGITEHISNSGVFRIEKWFITEQNCRVPLRREVMYDSRRG